MNNALFFSSVGDSRGTPQEFFDRLHAEFGFTLDAAADALNHKVDLWFGEGGLAFDALGEDWGGEGSVVWCNPPYSAAGAFVAKAAEEAAKGAVVVMLLPARTDTKWWHRYIWNKETHTWREGVQGRFLSGRLSFELKVSADLRELVYASMDGADMMPEDVYKRHVEGIVEATGLPKMAIEGIVADKPDEDLLSSAPFPSAVIVFRGKP